MAGPLVSLASIIGCSILTSIALEFSWRAWLPMVLITGGISIWSAYNMDERLKKVNREDRKNDLLAFSIVSALAAGTSIACLAFFPIHPVIVTLEIVMLASTLTMILLFTTVEDRHGFSMKVVGSLLTLAGYGYAALYFILRWETLITGGLLMLHGLALLITGLCKIRVPQIWKAGPLISLTIVIGLAIISTIALEVSWIAGVPMVMILLGTIAWSALCIVEMRNTNPRTIFTISATLTLTTIISTGLCFSRGWTIAIPSGLLLLYFLPLLLESMKDPSMRTISRVTVSLCYMLLIGSVTLSFVSHFLAPILCPIFLISTLVCSVLLFSVKCFTYGLCNGFLSVCFVLELLVGASVITAYVSEMYIIRMILCTALLTNTYVLIGCGSQRDKIKQWMPSASHVMFIANAVWFHLAYFYDPQFYPIIVVSSIVCMIMLVSIECAMYEWHGFIRFACVVQLTFAASTGVMDIAIDSKEMWLLIVINGWLIFGGIYSIGLAVIFYQESTTQKQVSVRKPLLQRAALFVTITLSVAPFIAYHYVRSTIPVLVPFLCVGFTLLYQLAIFIINNFKENTVKYNGRISALVLVVCIYLFIVGCSLPREDALRTILAFASLAVFALALHFLIFFTVNNHIKQARKAAAAAPAARPAPAAPPIVVQRDEDSDYDSIDGDVPDDNNGAQNA